MPESPAFRHDSKATAVCGKVTRRAGAKAEEARQRLDVAAHGGYRCEGSNAWLGQTRWRALLWSHEGRVASEDGR